MLFLRCPAPCTDTVILPGDLFSDNSFLMVFMYTGIPQEQHLLAKNTLFEVYWF